MGYKLLALASVLHSLCVAAQTVNHYPMFGANSTAPFEGYTTFVEAASNSNVSHTVSFAHFYDNSMGSVSNNPQLNNWTWTVKVSDVQLPNISTSHPNLTHVAYTTYEFSWPEQGDLNAALSAENNASQSGAGYKFCAYLINAQFPDSVSKKWDGTSSCSSALGANCTETLTKMISSSSSCDVGFALDNPDFIAACKSSFGSTEGDGWGISPFVFGNGSTSAKGAMSLEKNQTWAYFVSEPYTAGNATLFEEKANNLQVFALTGSQTNLVCNRAGDGKSLASAAPSLTVSWTVLVGAAFAVSMFGSF